MSYIYKLKDGINKDEVIEKLKEMEYDLLPFELCGLDDNDSIYFKVIEQPRDGECVKTLINHYNMVADKICSDKLLRKMHAEIGIKFRKKGSKYRLIITDELKEMFSYWRLEINFYEPLFNVYFTISDGSFPRFYDADLVMSKYCSAEIEILLLNDIIEKIEAPKQEQKEKECEKEPTK